MNGPALSASRLTLRPIEDRDLEIIRNWRNSPGVSDWLFSGPQEITETQQRAWYGGYAEDETQMRWVIDTQLAGPIGVIGVTSLKGWHGSLTIFIGDPAARRMGYGYEALTRLCAWLWGRARTKRLIAELYADNKAAKRLYEKAGFHFVAPAEEQNGRPTMIMEKRL